MQSRRKYVSSCRDRGRGDDNPDTERDAGWQPMIVTPVQPEHPCAHCIVAATIAAVIRIEVGREPLP